MPRNRPDSPHVVSFNGVWLTSREFQISPDRPAPRSRRRTISRRHLLLNAVGASAALALAACDDESTTAETRFPQTPTADAQPTASPAPEVARATPSPDVTAAPQPTPQPTATAAPTPITDAPIPEPPFDDADVDVLLYGLLDRRNRPRTQAIVDAIVASGDERFIAVLIELIRFNELAIIQGPGVPGVMGALESLTGQVFIYVSGWAEWYAKSDLQAPPGFSQWKGWLLGGIDPRMTEFFQGEDPGKIRSEEVLWGGVRVDGIPPLENPAFRPAADVDYLEPDDLLFGVSINGDHRAYPLRILDWHEMANDVVGGVPVSLAYCTLCGAGVLFDGRVGDTVFTFGTSGLLMRSNKLMYDRNTRSLWNQLSGEPVLGPLASSGLQLNILPVVVSTWADWTAQHPGSLALDFETGYARVYTPGAAYGAYFASPETRFPVPFDSPELRTKDRVFGLTIDGIRRAYPTKLLTERVVVNDELAGQRVVIVAPRGNLKGEGRDRTLGAAAIWQAGAEVRAYDGGNFDFTAGDDPQALLDQDGAAWQVTEEALLGPNGERLERLPGHLAYWFGWFNFFPDSEVYSVEP